MKKTNHRKLINSPNLVLVGILLAVSFWIIDPLIDSTLFHGGSFWDQALNPNSEEIWLRSFVAFILMSFGVFAGSISSRNKRIEKELRNSEEKFRLMYEDAPLGYQSLNEAGQILEVNQAWLGLTGYREDEVVGRWFGDFLDEESKANFTKMFPIFKSRGEVHGVEFTMIKKDGFPLAVSFYGRIWRGPRGEFRQTHCMMHDDTDRKTTEEILRRGEARFRELAELLPETVIETDCDGNLTFINCHALNKFRYSAEDFQKGLNIFQFVIPEDRERAIRNFKKLFEGRQIQNNEYTVLKKDGTPMEVEIYSAPIIQNNVSVGLRGIVLDITERKNSEKALRLSEERFRTIADFTYGWEDWFSPSGSLLWTNPSVERITGYTVKECLSMPNYPADLVVEEDKEAVLKIYAQAVAGNWIDDFTFRIRRKDGRIIWMAIVTQPVFDSEGRHLGTRASLRDISEQKRAKEALKQNEEKYRALVEQASDGIFAANFAGNYLQVNSSVCQMLGYSREELLQMSMTDLAHPDDYYQPAVRLQKLKTDGHLLSEDRLRCKDGSFLEVEINAKRLPDGTIQGIIRDITARKKVERALHESERRFRLAVENYPGAVIIYNSERKVMYANPQALAYSGLTLERIYGRTEDQIFPKIIVSKVLPLQSKAFETGEVQSGEFEFGEDITPSYASISYIPLLDERGKVCQLFGFGQDITERKKAEEELRENKERYQQLYNDANVGLFRTRMDDGLIGECNDYAARMFGYEDRLSIIDKISAADLWISPAARQEFIEMLNEKGEVKNFECNLGRGSVHRIWANVTARICPEKGYMEGVISDITEKKRIEEQIVILSRAIEQSPISIVLTDLQGNIEYVNPKFTEITGYSHAEALGKNPRILKSGLTRAKEYERLWKTISAGGQWSGEFQNRKKNGELFWEKATISPIRNKKGEMTHYLGVKEDVTEKKRIEEALLDREEKYRTLFEYSADGIFLMTDLFLDCNEQACKMWACNREDIIDHSPIEFSPQIQPDGRRSDESAKDKINRALAGNPQRFYWKYMRKDGTLMDTEVALKAIIINDKTIIQATVRDITERMQKEEALRNSEERFQRVLEDSPLGVVMSGPDFRFIKANNAFCQMLGYTENELMSLTYKDITHPDQIARDKEQVNGLLHGDIQMYKTEKRYLRKDGKVVWGSVVMSALRDKDGQFLHFMAIIEDITERKEAAERLASLSSRNEAMLASIPDIIMEVNDKKIYTWANRAGYQFFGDDVIGKDAANYFIGYQNTYDTVNPLFEGNEDIFYVESWQRRKDGEERLLAWWCKAVKGIDGKVTGAISTARDITELNHAREALAGEKERLAVTLRSIGDGVITTDTDGNIVLVNSVAEQLTGWKSEEASGKPLEQVFRIISEKTRAPIPSPVEKALVCEKAVELDNTTLLLAKDGTEYIIADSAAPIKDAKNQMIGVVLVFRDITEKTRIEEELARTDKLESLGVLAGGIAHDFNNILTAIMGNITLAKMNLEENSEISKILTDAETASTYAQELASQLLTFARGGAPVKKAASINQLIKEISGFALRGSKVSTEFHFDEDLHSVEFDEGQICQAFNNLMINSCQAMPNGGVIKISASNVNAPDMNLPFLNQGDWVRISIQDTGFGIPQKDLNHIFDPFFTTKKSGTGLGLAISYSIIKKHGGYIEVESTEGSGSTFVIYLPASQQTISDSREVDRKPTPGSGRILIMDDDEGVLAVASICLSRLGYQVSTSKDGREAIEIYKNAKHEGHPFDAVIMDLTVPGGLGGKDTITILRESDPDVKAIVSSGYCNDPIVAEYEKHGFAGALSKPYKAPQLARTLQSVLSKSKSGLKAPTGIS